MTQNRLLVALFIFGVGFASGSFHRAQGVTTGKHGGFSPEFVSAAIYEANRMGKESIVLESLDYKPSKPNPGIDKPLRVANK